jgi:MFS family permease
MMFSVQSKAVGPHRQGSVVGLRQTMNRLAAIAIPPMVGSIADHWGADRSFVFLGAVLIVLCAPVALITRRVARMATTPAEPSSSD